MSREFALNLSAVVTGDSIEIALRIGELVGVQSQLGFGDLKIVTGYGRRAGFRRRLRLGGEAVDLCLVLRHKLLEFGYFLRERQSISGKNPVLRRSVCLAKSCVKSLIHFVIGKSQGIVRELCFLCGNRQRSQSLRRLPGTQIDECLLVAD